MFEGGKQVELNFQWVLQYYTQALFRIRFRSHAVPDPAKNIEVSPNPLKQDSGPFKY
jgi:hypothetical protein